MDRLSLPLKRSSLLAAAAFALCAASCDSPVEISSFQPPIDEVACQQEDVPPDFDWQTAGTFTRDDLAGVADDPDGRREELREAGVIAGYFSNWRQRINRPPFESPVDLTCQAIAFETADEAAAFVANLRPEPGGVVAAAVTWLPDGEQGAEELDAPAGAPAGSRHFRVDARDGDVSVTVHAILQPNGPFVQAVFAGGEGQNGRAQAAATALALAARTTPLIEAAKP